MKPAITDTHCHLASRQLADDLPDVVERARDAGVHRLVTIGTDLEDGPECLAIAERFAGVYAAVGIHPCSVLDVTDDDWLDQVKAMAGGPRVAALGEIGLDYFHPPPEGKTVEEYRSRQREFFIEQLDLAVALGLNVVVHQRDRGEDCWRDLRKIIAPYAGKVRAVFHCFTHSWEEAEKVVRDGHLISFTGIATFKNAKEIHACAADAATGSFMLETDAPYLAPEPHRGKCCEPAHTSLTGQSIAGLRGQSIESLAAETEATAAGFFRFLP